MIDNRHDSRGKTRLVVRKSHSSATGTLSAISAEFSAQGWNKITMEYFDSVKQLGTKRLKIIFDLAKSFLQKGACTDQLDIAKSDSGCAILCSDEENW
jgi:uncharacterized protein with von Willebrand factor type A (vWA) domain